MCEGWQINEPDNKMANEQVNSIEGLGMRGRQLMEHTTKEPMHGAILFSGGWWAVAIKWAR